MPVPVCVAGNGPLACNDAVGPAGELAKVSLYLHSPATLYVGSLRGRECSSQLVRAPDESHQFFPGPATRAHQHTKLGSISLSLLFSQIICNPCGQGLAVRQDSPSERTHSLALSPFLYQASNHKRPKSGVRICTDGPAREGVFVAPSLREWA